MWIGEWSWERRVADEGGVTADAAGPVSWWVDGLGSALLTAAATAAGLDTGRNDPKEITVTRRA